MRQGLVLMCGVGCLLVAGVTEGRAPAPAAPVLDKATAAEVRKLQEERREVLVASLKSREKLYQSGRAELDGVIESSKRLLAADLDLATTGAERLAALERQYEKAQSFVELAKAKYQAARGTEVSVFDAQAYSLAAKIGLLKAGGKLKKAAK